VSQSRSASASPLKYDRTLAPAPVLSQNLNSDVLMMESTEDWYRRDGAELLRSPKIRRIFFQ